MDPIIVSIIGVSLSITFFAVNYRRTVGAKRERIENANTEILSKLFSRIIRENYEPSREEIEIYIEGKAIEKKLLRSDLLSIEQVMAKLYSEMLDNEILDPTLRQLKLSTIKNITLNKYLDNQNNEDDEDDENNSIESLDLVLLSDLEKKPKKLLQTNKIITLLGVVSSFLGATIGLSIDLFSTSKSLTIESFEFSNFLLFAITFLLSLIILLAYIIFNKFKEDSKNETVRVPTSISSYISLEKRLISILTEKEIRFFEPKRNSQISSDYIIKNGAIDIPIELKSWSIRPNKSTLLNTVAKLKQDIDKLGSPFGYLITGEEINVKGIIDPEKLEKVKIISIKRFEEERFDRKILE